MSGAVEDVSVIPHCVSKRKGNIILSHSEGAETVPLHFCLGFTIRISSLSRVRGCGGAIISCPEDVFSVEVPSRH